MRRSQMERLVGASSAVLIALGGAACSSTEPVPVHESMSSTTPYANKMPPLAPGKTRMELATVVGYWEYANGSDSGLVVDRCVAVTKRGVTLLVKPLIDVAPDGKPSANSTPIVEGQQVSWSVVSGPSAKIPFHPFRALNGKELVTQPISPNENTNNEPCLAEIYTNVTNDPTTIPKGTMITSIPLEIAANHPPDPVAFQLPNGVKK